MGARAPKAPKALSMQDLPGYCAIPLALIDESPTNPRKKFDEAALDELAASIRAHGVLEPTIVRPKGMDRFELVVGARRRRGAVKAELTHLPCLVRNLSDVEVLDIQVVENNQRQDVSPLEEGDTFVRMIELGRTTAQIADRLGRTAKYVEQRVRLARADEKVRALVEEDVVGIGSALLILTLPADQHAQLALQVRREFIDEGRVTASDVLRMISPHDLALERASFDTSDPDLVPEAGPCSTCPRNSATQLSLAGVSGAALVATCLDQECWDDKEKRHGERLVEDAKKRGLKVIQTDQDWKFRRPDEQAWCMRDRSVDEEESEDEDEEDEPNPEAKPVPKWGELTAERVVVVSRHRGIYEAIPTETTDRLEREANGGAGSAGTSRSSSVDDDYKARQAKTALENKIKAEVTSRAMHDVVATVESSTALDPIWRLLALALIDGSDRCMTVCARRGIEAPKAKAGSYRDHYGALREHLETLSVKQVRGLALELALTDGARSQWAEGSQRMAWEAALKLANVDMKEATKVVRAELVAEAKAKAAKKKAAEKAKAAKAKGAGATAVKSEKGASKR